MEEKEKSCMDCKNSVWCRTWGEFKCVVKQRRIYEPENEALNCEDFKKERKKDDAKCQCKHCLSLVSDDE